MKKDKKMLENKTHTATWNRIEDPLHYTECPNCHVTIFMSRARTIDKMIEWAKQLAKRG